jgi:hypothetical protein
MRGTDSLSDAIVKHFKFVKHEYFGKIYLFIKAVAELTSSDYNNISSITGFRFKVGEVIYYHKKGAFHIIVSDKIIEEVKPMVENYFEYFEFEKQYDDDEYSTIIISLF